MFNNLFIIPHEGTRGSTKNRKTAQIFFENWKTTMKTLTSENVAQN